MGAASNNENEQGTGSAWERGFRTQTALGDGAFWGFEGVQEADISPAAGGTGDNNENEEGTEFPPGRGIRTRNPLGGLGF